MPFYIIGYWFVGLIVSVLGCACYSVYKYRIVTEHTVKLFNANVRVVWLLWTFSCLAWFFFSL